MKKKEILLQETIKPKPEGCSRRMCYWSVERIEYRTALTFFPTVQRTLYRGVEGFLLGASRTLPKGLFILVA